MDEKIILSIDSTCDLNDHILDVYNIKDYPYTIMLENKPYKDNVDITPPDIYKAYAEKKILPKTSAINIEEYYNHFKLWVDKGYEIIHINLGSALTSSHNNCRMAAEQLEGVYPIDSQNLSTGSGLLAMKAVDMIREGLTAKKIVNKLKCHRENIHMSFILNTLEFLYAGGRCSKVSSLGANFLKIKPVINVDNSSGAMSLGNKYRGTFEKVIVKYIKDKLSNHDNINDQRMFIVHSGIDDKFIELAKKTVLEYKAFKEIYITVASCTISSHCGPNTLGIAFETK